MGWCGKKVPLTIVGIVISKKKQKAQGYVSVQREVA